MANRLFDDTNALIAHLADRGVRLAPEALEAVVAWVRGREPRRSSRPPMSELARPVQDRGAKRSHRLAYVGSDIFIECTAAADRMGAALGGQGAVALIGVVDPQSVEADARNWMFGTQLTNHYPGCRVIHVAGDLKYAVKHSARSLAESVLAAYPDVRGIFCNADEALEGVAAAVREHTLDREIVVIGYANEPQLMELVARGDVSHALLHNRYAYGHDAVTLLYNKIVAGETPTPERILHMPEVVSAESYRDHWMPEAGYLVSERTRASLVRAVRRTPDRQLRFALFLEGAGVWFQDVVLGARAAEAALSHVKVEVINLYLSDLQSPSDLETRRQAALAQAQRDGFDGVALWVLNEAIVPYVNEVVASGTEVVVFHTEPVVYDFLTPEVDELFSSLYWQLKARESAERLLARQSNEDELTGLANRRRLRSYLEDVGAAPMKQESGQANDGAGSCGTDRRSTRLNVASVLMVDLDRFKSINDRFGHFAGDRCLRAAADCLRAVVRQPQDLAARFGGEEFIVILPGATLEDGRRVAERVRASIESLRLEHDGQFVVLTASIGVAEAHHQDGLAAVDWDAIVKAADAAVYRAKEQGRNRVELAPNASTTHELRGLHD